MFEPSRFIARPSLVTRLPRRGPVTVGVGRGAAGASGMCHGRVGRFFGVAHLRRRLGTRRSGREPRWRRRCIQSRRRRVVGRSRGHRWCSGRGWREHGRCTEQRRWPIDGRFRYSVRRCSSIYRWTQRRWWWHGVRRCDDGWCRRIAGWRWRQDIGRRGGRLCRDGETVRHHVRDARTGERLLGPELHGMSGTASDERCARM